jgi:hypothetical protein
MTSVFIRPLLFATIIVLINGCAVSGPSPLIVSIRSGDTAAVETLIEEGADVNAMSRDWIRDQQWKLTPLVRASISGNLEIMQLLIEAGADVNGVDEWGDTPLMATVEFRHIEAAILLLENGADIDATKPNGTTALMIAARNEDLMSTDLLLRKGADPKIGLGSGDTALSLAAWNGNKEIVRLLIEYGAIPDNLAFARVQGYDKNIICILLENAALENAEIVEETEHTILNIGATTQVAGSNRVRSAILAEQTNKNICRLALTPTGDWEIIFPFNNYAAEARRRGYTADQCAALTGIATTQIAQAEMKRQAESNIHAAESGDVVAQHNLGVRYENGEGLRRDYTEALKWYRKAAESGYAPSQNNLGNMYAEGIGVEKDNQEARKWYLKAAEQGLARAQYNLGIRSLKVETIKVLPAPSICLAIFIGKGFVLLRITASLCVGTSKLPKKVTIKVRPFLALCTLTGKVSPGTTILRSSGSH